MHFLNFYNAWFLLSHEHETHIRVVLVNGCESLSKFIHTWRWYWTTNISKNLSRALEALFSFYFGTGVISVFAKQQVLHFSSEDFKSLGNEFSTPFSLGGPYVFCQSSVSLETLFSLAKWASCLGVVRKKKSFPAFGIANFSLLLRQKKCFYFKDPSSSIVNYRWYRNQIHSVTLHLRSYFWD